MAQSIKVGSDAMSIGSQLLRQGVSAIMHGVAQGFIQGVSGGDFGQSFLTAAVSSIAAGAFGFDGNGASEGLGWANSVRGSDVGQLLFGTVAGGVTSDLQGGNFWEGAAMGLTVSGLNHVAHMGDPGKRGKNPLEQHRKEAISLEKWEENYSTCTPEEIRNEAEPRNGLPGGPRMRYVINPVDNQVMDMRHVTVVGAHYGVGIGEFIEHVQNLTARTRPSAYDPQDYYSNKIGATFTDFRNSGSWASSSWAYDFQRFIVTQYRTIQPVIMNYVNSKR